MSPLPHQLHEHHRFTTELGTLILADCTCVLPNMPAQSMSMIITDPPYGVQYKDKNPLGYMDSGYDIHTVALYLYKLLIPDSRCLVFSASKNVHDIVKGFEQAGFVFHQYLIWHKPNFAGGGKSTHDFTNSFEFILLFHKGRPPRPSAKHGLSRSDVLTYPVPQSNFHNDRRVHPHQKPLRLIKHLLALLYEGSGPVLDPFAGSGTVAVACEEMGIPWYAIERNEHYYRIAVNRIREAQLQPSLFTYREHTWEDEHEVANKVSECKDSAHRHRHGL